MQPSEFPLIVDKPRDVEVLGSAPSAAALADAVGTGLSAGLLAALGGWMCGGRDLSAAIVPALLVGAAVAVVSFLLSLSSRGNQRGEVFTFWPDRFERSGPGGGWLMRYGEIATVRFVSRWRVEIVSLGGQPRVIGHMVFSFMQRLQEAGAAVVAQRVRQQEIASGRSTLLAEPVGFGGRVLLWLARMGVLAGLVWFSLATYLARELRPAPFDGSRGLIGAAVAALACVALARLVESRVEISDKGVRRGGRFVHWGEIERITSDMHGVQIRPKSKEAAIQVSWHATNAFALPALLESMVVEGTRVDRSAWASPWHLMGADTVSFEIPD